MIARLNYHYALETAKAAHDSAPELTADAYAASAEAFAAAGEFTKVYLDSAGDPQVLPALQERRDEAFQAALEAWKEHRNQPTEIDGVVPEQTQASCNESYTECLAKTTGVSEGTWGDHEHLVSVCDVALEVCLDGVAGTDRVLSAIFDHFPPESH